MAKVVVTLGGEVILRGTTGHQPFYQLWNTIVPSEDTDRQALINRLQETYTAWEVYTNDNGELEFMLPPIFKFIPDTNKTR